MLAKKIKTNFLRGALIALAVNLWLPVVNATVDYPQLEIVTLTDDNGVNSISGNMTIDASAVSILTGPGTFVDIDQMPLTLSATYAGASGPGYLFDNGTLTVGSAVGSLLTATFENFTVTNIPSTTMATFTADLLYTGGEYAGSFTGGTLEGLFSNVSGDLSGDFTALVNTAKIGPVVVPLPPAVWLLSGSLLALASFARRR